ncbi:hypothetical protein [uncultured Thiodictyon sp.]|uniref:hypothetical protein n=1 Tax=uncultured Thiodictyon sp. TaxID=1846217 RepID=UPI0025FA6C81|nr:hypothetical protein [uncultured Thiodictyon sp.]
MLLEYCRPDSDDAELVRVIVVGPYPTREFFQTIAESLFPKNITLYADDGWPLDQLEDIEKYLNTAQITYGDDILNADSGEKLYEILSQNWGQFSGLMLDYHL